MDQADKKIKQKTNPRETAGILSIVFFWWMNPLLSEGYKKEMEIEDLYKARKEDESEIVGDRLEKSWKDELKISEASKAGGKKYNPSLTKALVKTFGPRYAMLGFFTFIEECLIRIYQPLFMGWLIGYFSPGSQTTEFEAYLYATGVVGMAAVYTFTHHPYFFGVMHTGMKLRVACCSLLYRKALKLSSTAMGQTTVGQMVNLLSNDVNRFDLAVLFLHYLWCGPLQLIIVTTLLYMRIGPSALVGAVLLICAVPLQTWVGTQFARLRVQTAEKTDKRIRLMNEIVNGMKVIKTYTWEKSFSNLVHEARENEIKVVRNTSHYRSFNFSFFFSASRFVLMATLFVFGLTGEVLTAEKAFLCLAMFNTVRLSMTLFFPLAITLIGETRVSIKRIQDFLLLEEIKRNESMKCEKNIDDTKTTIKINGLTAKWNKDENDDTLNDIDLSVKKGELIAVIGPVGSGKSSIIQSILGELPAIEGKLSIYGDLSYAPQEPWVFGGSIRQNILFGQVYNKENYWRVIEACALTHDIRNFEFGDQTLVGERGVALSGGQKARVTLARAIYRDADTYLLDDPLSAVDAHVGRHLFEDCIKGFLKDKAVILVTHQLQYLQQADEIIVLKQGKIQERGTFQHLIKNGMDFSSFLAEEAEDEEEDIKDDDIENIPMIKRPSALGKVQRIRTLTEQTDSRSVISEVLSHSSITQDIPIIRMNQNKNTEEETKDKPKQDEVKEQRSSGSVKFKVYLKYFRAGGNWFSVFFLFFMNVFCQVLFTLSDVWLSFWSSREEAKLLKRTVRSTFEDISPSLVTIPSNSSSEPIISLSEIDSSDHYFNLGIYGAIVVLLCVISMIRTIYFFVVCMNSSVNLHDSMFQSIIRAPCRFFDTNPVGRILNRFSKDIGSMDELLPPAFFDVMTIGLMILAIVIVTFAVRPWVIIPTVLLGVIFIFLRKFYMASARDIKRLEGIAKSPIFSQLSTSLQGLSTIRAFSAESLLRSEFDHKQDIHTSAWFTFISATRWFGVWLDWIVVVYLGLVVYSFLLLSGDLKAGDIGLAISNCIMLTGMLQWGVRQSAEVENLMTSVERVMEYSELEPEDDQTKPNKPDNNWPDKGVVEFSDLHLRYDKDEKDVLKGINFKTKSNEKVGIVGRTGAGKSSLISALFRLAEPTGNIIIDGVQVLELGLHDLRSKLSIIPQDPLLFTGTLRRNLDPFDDYTDDEVWRVLKEVHLAEAVSDLRQGLETEMSEGGSNLSVGQRQLVCLARAVLRDNKILVLDEATANVDPKTDSLIQEQIRTRFKNCTVLTIAHRLHTIMDCDRILVLSDGKVAEFGTPYELLCDQSGVLHELASQTGEASKERLLEISRVAYFAQLHMDESEHIDNTNNVAESIQNKKDDLYQDLDNEEEEKLLSSRRESQKDLVNHNLEPIANLEDVVASL